MEAALSGLALSLTGDSFAELRAEATLSFLSLPCMRIWDSNTDAYDTNTLELDERSHGEFGNLRGRHCLDFCTPEQWHAFTLRGRATAHPSSFTRALGSCGRRCALLRRPGNVLFAFRFL